MSSLTLATAVEDAREAVVGCIADLYGNTPRTSLAQIFLYRDRLRGLGVLLIAVSLVGLFVEITRDS